MNDHERPSEGEKSPSLHIALSVFRWFEFGGMQRTFRRIAEALVERGHRVELHAARWDGPPVAGAELREHGVRGVGNHRRNAAFAEDFSAAADLSRPDLRVGFTRMPGLDLYYAGDPCFRHLFLQRRGWRWLGFLPRYRDFLAQEKAVFGPDSQTEIMLIAHGQARVFQEHYDTPSRRLHLLPPGIDRDRLDAGLAQPFDRAAHRRELGLSPSARVVLTVGSGFRTKGVDRTLSALAQLDEEDRRDLVFVVVGEGKPDQYEAQARKSGLTFLAAGPRTEVVPFYRDAEFLVHPARIENTGTTLIEAMYCGLPVLCSDVCGFAEHVERAAGGVVLGAPFLMEEYVSVLGRALTGEERAAWSAAAQAYTRREDLYGLIAAAAILIESLAAKKASESSR